MPELRWTLLIIGVVFIVVLAWWERRKPHQAAREAPEIRPVTEPAWGGESETPGLRAPREPTLTLPEMRAREPLAQRGLPVVEISDDSLIGLRVDGEPVEEQVAAAEALADPPLEAIVPLAPEPRPPAPVVEETAQAAEVHPVGAHAPGPHAVAAHPPEAYAREAHASEGYISEVYASEVYASEAYESEAHAPEPRAPGAPAPEAPAPEGPASNEPIVDWPPEESRKLLGLRLVAPQLERLAGRAVRQALSAEGFILGKYGIFHKPDAHNRAVLSAASLTKPGTFDLDTMDTQRFVGLNLFAVLPGPKPPLKAFDELLVTARALNERLEGALQDDRGGPLTPTRAAALRSALEAEARS